MPAGMVCLFPTRIRNRAFPNFHDAVAGCESNRNGRVYQFHVRPLEAVSVHVVSDFAEKNSLFLQNAMSFSDERRVHVGEVIALFERCLENEAETLVEILGLVLPLIRDVGRIVNDHIEAAVFEGHPSVIAND